MFTIIASFVAGSVATLGVIAALGYLLFRMDTGTHENLPNIPRPREQYKPQRGPFPMLRKVDQNLEPIE